MIPFAAFEPDRAPFNTSANDQIINVLPVADGYKPMPTLVEISQALEDECLGAVGVVHHDGFALIAGTSSKLYQLDLSQEPYAWEDISRASGYDVPLASRWSFAVFGDHVVACQLGDQPQRFALDNSNQTFEDVADAPIAAQVWVSGDFLVFGQLQGQPNAIQWSGINDMNHWEPGRKGSDIQVFPDGGDVMQGFGSQSGGIVVQRDKMRFMSFAPQSSYTFTFSEANPERGILAPNSLAIIGPDRFLYLCKDGFFANVEGQPIGATRIDEWFFDEVDHNYLTQVHAVVDAFEKIVWWIFKTRDGSNKLLGYHWQLDRWCQSDQDIQAAVSLLTPGVTWDGLSVFGENPTADYLGIDDYTDQIDADPELLFGIGPITIDGHNVDHFEQSFDSSFFTGGSPVFAGFGANNKLGFLVGDPAEATLETASVELNSSGRAFVTGARVICDVAIDQSDPKISLNIGASDHHGADMSYKSDAGPSQRSGKIPLRASGRLHRFKVRLHEGASWTAASAIVPEFVPEGLQ